MSFDANKPANSESPQLAPAQIRTNWGRLKTIINADHQFNDGAASNDGYHKVVHWINSTDPSYVSGTGLTYTKNGTVTINGTAQAAPQIYHRTSDGTTTREIPITPVPIRAGVSFQVPGSNGACTMDWVYGISGVTKTSTGRFTITFSPALPSIYYGMCASAVQASIVTDTRSATIVTRSKSTTQLLITCSAQGGNTDPDSIDLIVFGG